MPSSHDLAKARPRLRYVSPLSFWIVMIYASLNLLIGLDFFLEFDKLRLVTSLLVVNSVTNYHFWAIVFTALGLAKFYSLFTNNWTLMKNLLLTGVAIKAMWAIALLVRVLIAPGTVLIALLWVALALVQIVTFIYFMPPLPGFGRREDRTAREAHDGAL